MNGSVKVLMLIIFQSGIAYANISLRKHTLMYTYMDYASNFDNRGLHIIFSSWIMDSKNKKEYG
jgi:hypothetical protein